MKTLVIGYGNPGRLDDGLGPAFAREIERLGLSGVTVDSDYQLTVEDAAALGGYDAVVFADASVSGPEPFGMTRVHPGSTISFSSHDVEPSAVVALARELFGVEAEAWAIGIRGYEFDEFGEAISERARANMAEAVKYLEDCLKAERLLERA